MKNQLDLTFLWWVLPLKKYLRIRFLAIKYWLQGDEWKFAVEYATSIVEGFKK